MEPIPGLLALNVGGRVTFTAPSCTSPGNCAVDGAYTDGKSDERAFAASEQNGRWGKAQLIPSGQSVVFATEVSVIGLDSPTAFGSAWPSAAACSASWSSPPSTAAMLRAKQPTPGSTA